MKSFQVTTDYGVVVINPTNVTFLREQQVPIDRHAEECYGDNPRCPLQAIYKVSLGSPLVCERTYEVRTEVAFVNTIGPQSALHTKEALGKVQLDLDRAFSLRE